MDDALGGKIVLLVVMVVGTAFAWLGTYVARQKHRSEMEGLALGFLLGPVGVLIVACLPTLERQIPPVPENELEPAYEFRPRKLLGEIRPPR